MSRKNTLRVLMLSISVFSLSACGGDQRSVKTSAPMPPISEMDAAMNDTSPPPAPLPLSESDTLTPVMPVAASPTLTTKTASTTTTTTSAPAPSGNMEARMEKLEQSVSSLRTDYNRIMPAFASLNTTNERIQVLLDEMETEGKLPPGTAPRPVPVMPAPSPVAATTTTTTTAITTPGAVSTRPDETPVETTITETTVTETKPAVAETAPVPTSNTVTAVRIGEHGTKTRIVFDLTAKTKPDFKYDIDNTEKLLIVDMPASAWSAAQSGKPNSPLITGWTSGKSATGGTNVTVELKKEARILSTEYLKAEGKDPARLVIDIAATN